MIEPIGIVPQTRKRIVAFIRPCIRCGRDRLAEADLVDVVDDAGRGRPGADRAMSTGTAVATGASGDQDVDGPAQERHRPRSYRPTPIRAAIRLATSAPTRTPMLPSRRERQTDDRGRQPSSRRGRRRQDRERELLNRLTGRGAAAMLRRYGWPRTKRRPSRDLARDARAAAAWPCRVGRDGRRVGSRPCGSAKMNSAEPR